MIINKAEDYVHSSAADYVFGKQGGKVKVALLDSVQTTYTSALWTVSAFAK